MQNVWNSDVHHSWHGQHKQTHEFNSTLDSTLALMCKGLPSSIQHCSLKREHSLCVKVEALRHKQSPTSPMVGIGKGKQADAMLKSKTDLHSHHRSELAGDHSPRKAQLTSKDEPEGLRCNSVHYDSKCNHCKQHAGPTFGICSSIGNEHAIKYSHNWGKGTSTLGMSCNITSEPYILNRTKCTRELLSFCRCVWQGAPSSHNHAIHGS